MRIPDFAVDRASVAAAPWQQRVALVTGSYDRNIDGVALTLNRLVAHLLRRGHEVLVLCPSTRRRPVLRHAGATVVRVPSVPLPVWSEYRLTFGLGRAARRALHAFAPTVMHVAIQDAMGHAAVRWASERGIPSVCSHHTRFESYLGFYGLSALEPLFWFGMRRFHARCAATLPPSTSLAALLAERGIPRVRPWARGVETTAFSPSKRSEAWREALPGPAGAPVLLLVARLRWEKGLRAFASAVHEIAEVRALPVRVVVIGDGPARRDLRALLPPNATLLGHVTGEPLATAYASSDLFLYPSTTEGWGATCLEAQASGLPVVAAAAPGITDVVTHGEGGLLVGLPANATSLAAAAASLLADPPLRRSMGARGVRNAAIFTWASSGDRMLCEYARHAQPVPLRTASRSASAHAPTAVSGSADHEVVSPELSGWRPPPSSWDRLRTALGWTVGAPWCGASPGAARGMPFGGVHAHATINAIAH